MKSDHSEELARSLLTYEGPESDRVRTAIAYLADNDLQKIRHYIDQAQQDYRDVLWWAEEKEKEDLKRKELRGMTVNERLFALGLLPAFEAAVSNQDRIGAEKILNQCELGDSSIQTILDGKFKA